jgi:hypothetical protein
MAHERWLAIAEATKRSPQHCVVDTFNVKFQTANCAIDVSIFIIYCGSNFQSHYSPLYLIWFYDVIHCLSLINQFPTEPHAHFAYQLHILHSRRYIRFTNIMMPPRQGDNIVNFNLLTKCSLSLGILLTSRNLRDSAAKPRKQFF